MNDPLPDLAYIDKLIAEFQPQGRRPAFRNLEPHHALILALRERGASFQTIHAILKHQGVTTSKSRIAEFVRTVLAESKPHRSRRRAGGAPVSPSKQPSALPPPIRTADQAPASSVPASSTQAGQTAMELEGISTTRPYTGGRGPRIARLRFVDATVSGGGQEADSPEQKGAS
jgi:hypothetical protein